VLRCEGCGKPAGVDANGWLAYLTVNNEVAVFCAECADRETGEEPSQPLKSTER